MNHQYRSIIGVKQGENLGGWSMEPFKGPYGVDLWKSISRGCDNALEMVQSEILV